METDQTATDTDTDQTDIDQTSAEQTVTHRKSETYTGHEVVGENGETMGRVTDVIYHDGDTVPTWLVVDMGLLRADHYAPVKGSYVTDDGRLVVPFDKRWLKEAPKATGDHVVDRHLEAELVDHYGNRNV